VASVKYCCVGNETVVSPMVKSGLRGEFSFEAKIYDKIWGAYDYDVDVRFLDELFRKHDCRSVIDVGCGTGNHALRLSKMSYQVTGIDVSPAMLEKARAKDKKGNVRFLQGDMKKLDSAIPMSEKFDAAICLGTVFFHLLTNKDVQTFLKALHGMLRKKGLFIFDARNAKKISEDHLNKLLVHDVLTEDKLQMLFLNYNIRDLRNRNVIVWKPLYLMNENGKLDLQIREHKLRWF
jgi:ubiquinone/menaquinone biosynthesis C-methylase UbiE